MITVSAGLIQQEEENLPRRNGALKVNGDPTWGDFPGKVGRSPHALSRSVLLLTFVWGQLFVSSLPLWVWHQQPGGNSQSSAVWGRLRFLAWVCKQYDSHS